MAYAFRVKGHFFLRRHASAIGINRYLCHIQAIKHTMKKYIKDLTVHAAERPAKGYTLLKLRAAESDTLPPMEPGQFVEVRAGSASDTGLRRPISINFVTADNSELWLLIHEIGARTRALGKLRKGDTLNCILPLGNGFRIHAEGARVLLVGGGVGTAPLLYYGRRLREAGCRPTFLLGGRTAEGVLQGDLFARYGDVYLTTEDGSAGERGFVTDHSLWKGHFDAVATCGPKPMMQAVARKAREKGLPCEASLENMMACGLGACLCCVEKTKTGNLCVCQSGPVFNTQDLQWLD